MPISDVHEADVRPTTNNHSEPTTERELVAAELRELRAAIGALGAALSERATLGAWPCPRMASVAASTMAPAAERSAAKPCAHPHVMTVAAPLNAWCRALYGHLAERLPEFVVAAVDGGTTVDGLARSLVKSLAPVLPRIADESFILQRIDLRDLDAVQRYLAAADAEHVAEVAREVEKRAPMEATTWMRDLITVAAVAASAPHATA